MYIHIVCYYVAEKEGENNIYVEEKLNNALSEKLKDIDSKIENAEHSRAFFGEEMYQKLIEIDKSRSDALALDRGRFLHHSRSGTRSTSKCIFRIKFSLRS